jgi:NAD-dependent SIR2 family protein deacetylase
MLPTPPPSSPMTPSRKRKAPSDDDDDELVSSQSSNSSRRSSLSPSSKLRGQDLFDSRLFQDAKSTVVFHRFIAALRQKIHDEVQETSASHKFIRTLRDGGRLMRCYTQNIDGLEAREGLSTDLRRGKGNKRRFMKKHYEAPLPSVTTGTDFDPGCEVVQLHGDLDTLRCTVCATQFTWTDNETEIFEEGCAPRCVKCSSKSDARQANGKRGLAVGSLRPNIVLYGEDHPSNAILNPFPAYDASCQPEVLIIMGTSLKVYGLQKIVREFAKAIHSLKNGKGKVIFINRTRPAESTWDNTIDYFVSADCDEWVADLKQRRSDIWLRQGEIDLKVTKPLAKRKRKSDVSEEDARPAKKVKITVEIPAPKSKIPVSAKTAPNTPRKKKATPYKVWEDPEMTKTPRRPMFSPITPVFSPITPRTMKRSPLRSQLSNVQDEPEIEESDHSESGDTGSAKNQSSEVVETPSKGPGGRKKDMHVSAPGKENMTPRRRARVARVAIMNLID